MRILIESRNYADYLAKCHEALRTGLRALFDVRCFGKGYPGYSRFTRTYAQIIRRKFPDAPPDLLLIDHSFPENSKGVAYAGFAELDVPKAIQLGDYWYMEGENYDKFVRFVLDNRIDVVFSYFPQPLDVWAGTPIASRMVYLPPAFDPKLFNDWRMTKTYDVGFLAAGTTQDIYCYPERRRIHQKLLARPGLRYLWAEHPGWGAALKKHPLVGAGYSRAINSCRMFVTTSGTRHTAHAKYVEILAARSLLLADEPVGGDKLRLQDGVNYVKVCEDDILDKIDYYLARPKEAEQIAEAGYQTALRYHSCYARAADFYAAARAVLDGRDVAEPRPALAAG